MCAVYGLFSAQGKAIFAFLCVDNPNLSVQRSRLAVIFGKEREREKLRPIAVKLSFNFSLTWNLRPYPSWACSLHHVMPILQWPGIALAQLFCSSGHDSNRERAVFVLATISP